MARTRRPLRPHYARQYPADPLTPYGNRPMVTPICIPFLTTMLCIPPERRTTFGVKPNTVRLSIGIEPVNDLLSDIDAALDKLRSRARA